MKIAISGAVSTGKTTLGRALAEDLDLPFIPENLETVFGPLHLRKPHQGGLPMALLDCLHRKRCLEQNHDGFVVDRSPVDILNFWLAFRLMEHPKTEEVYGLCQNLMANYDAVVLLPWGVLELDSTADPDTGVRRQINKWVQLNGSMTIAGLAHHFVAEERIIRIPREITGKQDRLDFVKTSRALSHWNPAKQQ